MPGLFALLSEEISLHRQSTYKEKKAQGESEKKTDSVTSTDDESVDDEPTARINVEDQTSGGALDGVELSFDEGPKEDESVYELKIDAVKETPEPEQQKDTKSKMPARGVFRTLSTKGSWFMNKKSKKNKASETKMEEEDSHGEDCSFHSADESVLSAEDHSTFAPPSPLRQLAAEEQEAMDKEMDQLISEALVGFDNAVIEKELDDQKSASSLGKYVSKDIQTGAEGFLAAWVDRLDIFASWGGCGTKFMHSDDDVAIEVRNMQSRYSERDSGMDSLVLNQDISMEREIVLNDDETVTVLSHAEDDTFLTFDDESIASEYDDFNKAMMMLKRRAAHHRLSDVRLLEKIQTEQKRRMSQGLTATMVEI